MTATDVGTPATIEIHAAPEETLTLQPSPTTFEEALDRQLRRARELMLQKQHDYGPGNIMNTPLTDIFGAWEIDGIDRTTAIEMGIFVRLFIKISRMNEGFQNAGNTAVPGETLEDTWRDIVGYGLIALMVRDGHFELPMELGKGDDVPMNWVHPGDEHPPHTTDRGSIDFPRHISSDGQGGQEEIPEYNPTAEERAEADTAASSRPNLVERTDAIRGKAAADIKERGAERGDEAEETSDVVGDLPPSVRRALVKDAARGTPGSPTSQGT
ncbi:MAG: hypothetical protein HN396_16755 [Gemmatimonadales bacterium]|jgi:hypothetical protein|nr:hypothetical protein [Gemmatimonadales bacterium]